MISEIQDRGFAVVRELLSQREADKLAFDLGPPSGAGRRGMLALPLVKELATSEAFLSAVREHVPGTPQAVRAIYFDKSPGANWLVAWHQDLTISVTHQAEAPGFGPWSLKDGLIHVQPPAELLQTMITLRLHLDDTDESNGALRLLPGSHRHGRLTAADIERLRGLIPEEMCCTSKGDALLMRPLTLHASGRSVSDRHRRVLHIEYAGTALPHGLHWNESA